MTSDLKPGAVLRQLRKEKGLSLEQVHEGTRIPMPKLKAIECDDYSAFPAKVYLLGSIRSYAKEVGADADNLLSLLNLHSEETGDDTAVLSQDVSIKGIPNEKSVDESRKGFVSKISYFAVVAVLVIVWVLATLLFKGDDKSTSISTPAESHVEQAIDAQSEPTLTEAEAIVLASEEGAFGASDEFSNNDAIAPANTAVSVSVEEEASMVEPERPVFVADETPESTAEIQQNDQVQAFKTAASTETKLDFAFTDQCWLQVKDANGEIVFEDLRQSGDNLRLFGLAPFSIMLGNARAVSLNMDDIPVTIRPRASSDTLRLTLDKP